ncbi:hypothetical protein RGR602_CH03465 [Rhizobium gallicum bv. gallicum R602sp]|uniref:Uncharacterized protein n=1 Tax=Rhizobium gallicum bv. gallicum R602sp TaxID=1041138 RepID=A0A0B4X858_9HYPH|nr:hypothetical protein RGR602_CH03465 [Rhizobium gallicum bv. gallicum R602sp]
MAFAAEEAPKALTFAGFHAIVPLSAALAALRRLAGAERGGSLLAGQRDRIFDNATALSRAEPRIKGRRATKRRPLAGFDRRER